MKRVKDLLAQKGSTIWSIAPEESVFEAVKLMAEKRIGVLMVLEEGELCGVVSERDYARRVVLLDRGSKTTMVREIMTDRVVFVEPEQTIQDCMSLMTEKHFRHLPVMDEGTLIGVLSMTDLVRAQLADQQYVISQLENYINQ
ncbi:MAG: CBS domain-containing protein [Granulosicoccaceae bacterium]